jgi:hypothetical protein
MSVLDEKTLKQLETSIPEIKNGISDLYDVSGDTVKTLTNKDIIENWETLEKAIDGDKDAYNEF